jgi:hypothetical protein
VPVIYCLGAIHTSKFALQCRTMTARYEFHRGALPFRTDFQLAGTQCVLSTNSQQLLRAAEKWRGEPIDDCAKSFEMELVVDVEARSDVRQGGHFRGTRHLVFASLPPNGFLVYDLLRKRVRGVLSPCAAKDDAFWNSLLLPITIGVMGTTMAVAPLHCACLDRNGKGLLIAGISGAGKSTLTAALGERRFAVVSDDWTYVSEKEHSLVAHGLGAPLKLLPDAARFFSKLSDQVPRRTLNGELAYEVNANSTMGFAVKKMSHPRWILFLERQAHGASELVPCAKEHVVDFFERSAEKLPVELTEANRSRAHIIQRLADCPAWILRTGESPQRTAETIERFLAEGHHATA